MKFYPFCSLGDFLGFDRRFSSSVLINLLSLIQLFQGKNFCAVLLGGLFDIFSSDCRQKEMRFPSKFTNKNINEGKID